MIRFGLIWALVWFLAPGAWTGPIMLSGLIIASVGVVRWYLRERGVILAERRATALTAAASRTAGELEWTARDLM